MAKYFRRDKERRRKGSTELSPTTPAFSADPAGREPVWTCSFSTRQLESDLESMFLLARRRKTVRSIRLTISKLSSHDRFSSNRASKQHEPLNILFCGADDFSVYSLRALRTLQEERPEKIAGIEVVCRPDKYTGRGLKKLHEGQIDEPQPFWTHMLTSPSPYKKRYEPARPQPTSDRYIQGLVTTQLNQSGGCSFLRSSSASQDS